jgi:hypothetical protein
MKMRIYLVIRSEYEYKPKLYLITAANAKEEEILRLSNGVYGVSFRSGYNKNDPGEVAAVKLSIALEYKQISENPGDHAIDPDIDLDEIPDWSGTAVEPPVCARPDVVICTGSMA